MTFRVCGHIALQQLHAAAGPAPEGDLELLADDEGWVWVDAAALARAIAPDRELLDLLVPLAKCGHSTPGPAGELVSVPVGATELLTRLGHPYPAAAGEDLALAARLDLTVRAVGEDEPTARLRGPVYGSQRGPGLAWEEPCSAPEQPDRRLRLDTLQHHTCMLTEQATGSHVQLDREALDGQGGGR